MTKIDQISGLILRPFLWPKLTKYLGKGRAHAAFCGGPLPPKLAEFAKKQRTQINNVWIWSITLRPYQSQKHGKGSPTQKILWELKTFKELNPRCAGRVIVGYLPLKRLNFLWSCFEIKERKRRLSYHQDSSELHLSPAATKLVALDSQSKHMAWSLPIDKLVWNPNSTYRICAQEARDPVVV